MVHPDYQYTPKLLPAMVSLIANDLHPCVLGSRILGGYALRGGMPWWKYIANRFLTTAQNLLMGAKLSEYHTGYRAYLLEWRTAQDAYSRSITIGGPSYVMINNLARSYIAADKYAQAMALAKEAVRRYPDDWRSLSLVGSAHLMLGQLPEAQAAFEGLIRRNPEKAFSGWVGISIVNLLRHDLVALKHSQQQANLAQATTDLSRLSPSEKSAFEYMRELMRSWEPRMQGVTSGAAPVPALGK